MKVVILESAEADSVALGSYVVKNISVATWHATYEKLKVAIGNLALFPQLGGVPEEFTNLNLTQFRQILSGMNRIIYEVRNDVVYIHLIIDTRRDLKDVLMQRLLR